MRADYKSARAENVKKQGVKGVNHIQEKTKKSHQFINSSIHQIPFRHSGF